jgi:hypothetical protein
MPRRVQVAFLVVAFLGAVSASIPIAFVVMHRLRSVATALASSEPVISAPCLLAPPVVAVVAALVLPYTVDGNRSAYIGALAILHAVLVVPALVNRAVPCAPTAAPPGQRQRNTTQRFPLLALVYGALAGAAATQHAHNLARFATTSPGADGISFCWSLLAAGFANNCQASIR